MKTIKLSNQFPIKFISIQSSNATKYGKIPGRGGLILHNNANHCIYLVKLKDTHLYQPVATPAGKLVEVYNLIYIFTVEFL